MENLEDVNQLAGAGPRRYWMSLRSWGMTLVDRYYHGQNYKIKLVDKNKINISMAIIDLKEITFQV